MLQSRAPTFAGIPMASQNSHQPAGTNLLGQALVDSRQKFRQLVISLDAVVASGRLEDGRTHLPKLRAMQTELHRLLHPNDPVDGKALAQIDRDVARLEKALKKGVSGSVGKGIVTLVIGGTVGVIALLWLMLKIF